jgi:DnaK suppressor protein
MANAETDIIAATLNLRRAELRAQLALLRGGAPSRTQASEDHFAHAEDSRAQTATARDLEFALDDRESIHLRQVEAALQRLALGTYGHCVDCGTAIPAARLQATPETERCLPCQEARERT